MQDYRCFFLDGENHYRDVEVLRGADDEDVIAKAQRLLAERDYFSGFELWQGPRLLTAVRLANLDQNG